MSYARVVRGDFQPGKIDEFLRLFESEFVPALQQESGFQQVVILADRTANSLLAVVIYASQADVEANEVGFRERASKAAPFLAGPPQASVYEVAVQA
jgi:quinol monooxygenase YgiN